MIVNEITYNSLKEEVKQLSQKYPFKNEFIKYIDNCGFETNPLNCPTLKSIELTKEIKLLIETNEKYNTFKILLKEIPKFAYCCDIGDLYSLWHIIYIKCSNPVIIIGAGVSGLTIASKLNDGPLLILEARDRIGGRVLTNDNNMDMGAAWLHGSDNNPLNELIDYNNLIPVSKCNPWMHSEKTSIEYMSSNGNISEDKRQQMAIKWNDLATKIGNMPNKTIMEAFEQLEKEKEKGFNESKEYDLETDNNDLSSFLYMIEVWCGGSVKNVSTSFLNISNSDTPSNYNNALFGDYGGSHYLFKNGAKSLIDAIINNNNNNNNKNLYDNIKCCQIVTDIIYNDYYVEIVTSSGQVYHCNKLCITIPPGPLKYIRFSPLLDTNKSNALSKIKMGAYKKIQIEFFKEDVFWKDNVSMFLTYDPKTKDLEQTKDHCPYILWNNYKFSKDKPILEAICPANIGWNLAGQTDEEIIEKMLNQLRNYYPVVPEPKA